MAIGTPQAAEVPILEVIGNPDAFKYGTEKIPPPIPRIDDVNPIPVPTK